MDASGGDVRGGPDSTSEALQRRVVRLGRELDGAAERLVFLAEPQIVVVLSGTCETVRLRQRAVAVEDHVHALSR
nr:hypothetical protein [Streptomyces sp. CB01881]